MELLKQHRNFQKNAQESCETLFKNEQSLKKPKDETRQNKKREEEDEKTPKPDQLEHAKKRMDIFEKEWSKRMEDRQTNIEAKKVNAKKEKKGETEMKKIQAFLKKIKGLSEPRNTKYIQAIVKELSIFKLDRYLEEIIRDLLAMHIDNGKDKCTRNSIVKLISMLCQLYSKFEKKLENEIVKVFTVKLCPSSNASFDELLSRQKIILHLLTELIYVGAIGDAACLVSAIKAILEMETSRQYLLTCPLGEDNKNEDSSASESYRENALVINQVVLHETVARHTLYLIIDFVDYAGEECIGYLSNLLQCDIQLLSNDISHCFKAPRLHGIFSDQQRDEIKQLFDCYFKCICQVHQKLFQELQKRSTQTECSGTSDEHIETLEMITNEWKQLITQLCEGMGRDIPVSLLNKEPIQEKQKTSARIKREPLTPIQQFIRELIWNKQHSQVKILEKLLKMPWNDSNIRKFIIATFFDIRFLSNEHIEVMAAIVSKLNEVHLVGTELADAIIEQIEIAMENNESNQDTFHLLCVKYLGELYVNDALHFTSILNVLGFIIKYLTKRLRQKDRFPIFAICELLDTCVKYLGQNEDSKKKKRCEDFQQTHGISFVSKFKKKITNEFSKMRFVDKLLEQRINDVLTKYNHKPINNLEQIVHSKPIVRYNGKQNEKTKKMRDNEDNKEATKDFNAGLDEINRGVGGSLAPKQKMNSSSTLIGHLKLRKISSPPKKSNTNECQECEFTLCIDLKNPGQIKTSQINVPESFRKQFQTSLAHPKNNESKEFKKITMDLIYQLSDTEIEESLEHKTCEEDTKEQQHRQQQKQRKRQGQEEAKTTPFVSRSHLRQSQKNSARQRKEAIKNNKQNKIRQQLSDNF